MTETEKKERENEIKEQIDIKEAWGGYKSILSFLHWFLGAVVVALSVTIASQPSFLNASGIKTLSWLLALVSGYITLFKPEERANRYRRAYNILSAEIKRFTSDPTFTVDHVLNAYSRGDEIIHGAGTDKVLDKISGKPTRSP